MPFDPTIFEAIDADLRNLEIDEIKQRLEPLLKGYHFHSPIFDPGAFLYRARKIGSTFNKATSITKKDLIYPPKHAASLGRLNRAGSPVFYSSIHKEPVFFEVPDLDSGDELILTFWRTTAKMVVSNIGYTESAFQQLGSRRIVPTWEPPFTSPGDTESTMVLPTFPQDFVKAALSKDDNSELKEVFSKYFTGSIISSESFRYKLTVAIGEIHLGFIDNMNAQFAGVLYPSVRMWANGDNIALLPWFVDKHLEFRKAVHVRIKNRTTKGFDIDYVDAAHEFDEAGILKWLGRIQAWSLAPKQAGNFRVIAGQDDDGDYTMSGGEPVHWAAEDSDTGMPLHRQ